jgi:DNA-binding MarR family transcriptional regulator
MAPERLSRLQRRILAWLAAEEQRFKGTIAASHQDLVYALAHDKGNLSTSLQGLEHKGWVTITRTPGGKAEAVDLTPKGRMQVTPLTGSCDSGGLADDPRRRGLLQHLVAAAAAHDCRS